MIDSISYNNFPILAQLRLEPNAYRTHRCNRWFSIVVSAAILFTTTLLVPFASAQTRWDSVDTSGGRDRGLSADQQATTWLGGGWLGGTTTVNRQWRLGVTGDNRETGVLVRNVASNSAAARARIEPGDLIVNVSGYQVGTVGGRLYDLAEEINRRADTNGFVGLVVQDRRSGQLASISVKLENHNTTLSGTLTYRDRDPLPPDALVTVAIENLSRPYFVVAGGQTQFRPGPGPDIPFEIAYDEAYVNSQDTYQVRATVTSGGRAILDTPQPQRVLTNGAPSQVRLALAPLVSFASGQGSVISAGYPNYNQIDDRVTRMYRKYLNREPSFVELAALRVTPGIESRLDTLPLEIMASQEYFDIAGNNNSVWLDRVFRQIVGRPPSGDEMQRWMLRFGELRFSRTDLLRQLNLMAMPA